MEITDEVSGEIIERENKNIYNEVNRIIDEAYEYVTRTVFEIDARNLFKKYIKKYGKTRFAYIWKINLEIGEIKQRDFNYKYFFNNFEKTMTTMLMIMKADETRTPKELRRYMVKTLGIIEMYEDWDNLNEDEIDIPF